MTSRWSSLLLPFALLSCGGEDPGGASDTDDEPGATTGGLGLVIEMPDGTKRLPYLGGAFVTRARQMPIEVEQAIMGIPTDRPVVVWAGLDPAGASEPADGALTLPERTF